MKVHSSSGEGDTAMQHYKNHPIYGFAISERGMLWHSRGVIFDPKHPAREIKRLECRDVIWLSREEAEEQALTLCRAWIDGLRNRR
jgi:hypothetical protein